MAELMAVVLALQKSHTSVTSVVTIKDSVVKFSVGADYIL